MNSLERFKPVAIAIGLSFSITACGGGGSGSGSNNSLRQLFVQPIQVCDDNGLNCADIQFYEDITDKIWGQAGIDVTFLTPNRLNDSTYLSIAPNPDTTFPFTNYEFYQLSFTGGPGAFGRHPDSGTDTGPINMWFVDQIESTIGLVFGTAWVGSNGILISDDTFSFNSGLGRIDTIAHEIGHNLGLQHRTFGAGNANNLMTAGTVRNSPSSITDITPDGANLDQLTQDQIDEARTSGFLEGASSSSNNNPGLIEPDQASQPADPTPDPDPTLAAAPPPDTWIASQLPASNPNSVTPTPGIAPSPKLINNWTSKDVSSGNGGESDSPFQFQPLTGPAHFSKSVKPVNIPEPFISPLIWLGIAASGLFCRRRRC